MQETGPLGQRDWVLCALGSKQQLSRVPRRLSVPEQGMHERYSGACSCAVCPVVVNLCQGKHRFLVMTLKPMLKEGPAAALLTKPQRS